jgi:hypothetical protein
MTRCTKRAETRRRDCHARGKDSPRNLGRPSYWPGRASGSALLQNDWRMEETSPMIQHPFILAPRSSHATPGT